MKFYISSTNDNLYAEGKITSKAELIGHNPWDDPIYGIEINSLEELMELQKEVGNPIIVKETLNNQVYSEYELEIYDGYRE